MRPLISWIRFWLALLLVSGFASPTRVLGGESPPIGSPVKVQAGNSAYCYSSRTTEGTVYFSPLFQTDASVQSLQDAFASFLAKQYGYAPVYGYVGRLTCATGLPNDKAEGWRQGVLNNSRALAQKVVETEWTYP